MSTLVLPVNLHIYPLLDSGLNNNVDIADSVI